MTDDSTSPATTSPGDEGVSVQPVEASRPKSGKARRRRTRTVLAAILVLLILLLLTLSVFVVSLLSPPGAPKQSGFSNGLRWIRSIYGWGKHEDQQLYAPTDTAVDRSGTIWVTDPGRWRILAFRPDGSYKTLIHQGPGVMAPQAIDVDRATGNVYVADYAVQKIWVISPQNKVLRSWSVPLPTEVSVRGNRVAVGTRYGIAVFDLQGTRLAYWGGLGKGPEQFDVVRGIQIGPDGTIYCSDTQNARIKAYTMEGKLKWIYPSEADLTQLQAAAKKKGVAFEPPFQIPSGMTMDARGRLELVDPFYYQIYVINPANGHIQARYGEYGNQDGQFSNPTSLAYDPARDWFVVADTDNDRAQIVRLPNSGTNAAAAGLARFSDGPIWICAVPLVLLLIAAIIMVTQRRRQKAAAEAAARSQGIEEEPLVASEE